MDLDWSIRGWRCFRAGLLLSVLATCCAAAASPKRVLILSPYGPDVAPFSAVISAFRSTLARELGKPVDIHDVPLDLGRLSDQEGETPLVAFLEGRIKRSSVDLVVPVGAAGVQFAARHRERLFPATPVLVLGAEPRFVPPDFPRTNTTLLTQRISLPGMVEDILQLRPETTNIAVVFGTTALENAWVKECRREFQAFTNRVAFTWLTDLPMQQVLRRCATLPPRSFILHGFFLVDAAGLPCENNEALRRIHEVGNAPLFGVFASEFGLGTIGGRLYQDSEIGLQGARTAIRILRGEKPENIPSRILEEAIPVYDWRELKRWRIREELLPAGSVIQFRQAGFWEQYGWQIAGILTFCCLQTGLIIGLLVNRTKRRDAETAATLVADLSSRFVNLPSSEVDRQIEDAQRRVCERLGLDLSALWQWNEETPRSLLLTHLFRPPGGPPLPEPMDAQEEFPWCLRQLVAGKVIVAPSIEALPAEAARDKEIWRHYGIKSSLTFPLSTGGGQLLGALSFNTIREERSWPESTVTRLQLVAQIFANALARKRADQELHDSEERLSLAADAAAVGLWRLNLATGCFWLTKKTRELFEFPRDGAVSFEQFLSLVHPDDQERIRQAVKTVVQLKNEIQVEYRVVRPDGSSHWIFSRGRVHCNGSGEPDYLMGVSSNITERRRTEEALRGFGARLISAQEKERARLARELHDDITQRLARLAIDVGRCAPGRPGDPAAEMARSVRDGLIQLSEDVHALSYRLHPSILEDLGLAAALKAEAARFTRQGASPIEVKVQDIPASIPMDVALCVFRVAQEALRNAVRHADAQSMQVSLRSLDNGLHLAVQDDGSGFDPSLKRDQPSLGLASMRERVHLVGGELEIESTPGHGTTVLAWVPLKEKES